ncbi:amidohydrolase family protein [Nakamurella sp. GG22]
MLAIRTSRLFDGEDFAADDATVVVDDGRIVGVEDGLPNLPEGIDIREVRDGTVLPGLIDTHAHLVADSTFSALDKVAGFTAEEIDAVITESLRRQLAAGVTTVRDLGDRDYSVVDRRDRGDSDLEPTILGSGPPLTSPGGHCHYMGGEVADRASLARMIDERVERRVDIVKVMASGGMTTPGTDVLHTQFSTEDFRFLVDRSHAAGLPVTAHAHGLPAVLQAIEVGVDGIEHCSCLTGTGVDIGDDALDTMVRSGIVVGGAFGSPPADAIDRAPQAIRDMIKRMGTTPEGFRAIRLAMVARMRDAGVTFVTGADSGINPFMAHGNLRRSAEFFVDAGATAAEALAASTSIAARACGVGDRKGLLRKDYDADILIVDGDLRAGIGALADVRAVLIGGREMAR